MESVLEVGNLAKRVGERVSKEALSSRADVANLITRALEEELSPTAKQAARFLIVRLDSSEPSVEQAYRDLARYLPNLVRERQVRLEEKQIGTLLDAFAPAAADDAQRALIMDNVLARRRFLEKVECLSSKEVAALSENTAKNLSMTATRWKRAGKVFSVHGPKGEELFPAFQFRENKPHPTVALALAELPKRKSPWQIAFWFASANGWLDGAAPMDRLDDPEAVVVAAKREAEDIIG